MKGSSHVLICFIIVMSQYVFFTGMQTFSIKEDTGPSHWLRGIIWTKYFGQNFIFDEIV